ncbi:LytR/AlgR family response regulator transcription factor [Dinghuibacter silviterrae]|uniref:LytTR family two component transcriptional regulator n=1 Tax=Dinghuibacter silviterrae TaxID=1539049 RepID=A0A4R8DFC7_9BACT|nr:LytTR family DNA-binding domain-containing protein [Dinghuibacter silviterrae]TDW96303.1 LytTR family two component transcriptional regulator [Dinghuibacter silviterrae]
MQLSCIIIDDEPNAVDLLEMFIRQATGWTLCHKCYDALEAMTVLKQQHADFVFLDINMPQLSGMELAALLPPDTRIVFTTAYSEYALDSYNFPTIDYLLKPITLKRFLAAQQKVEEYFTTHRPGETVATGGTPTPGDYFFVKSGKELRRILLDDILYFEGEKEYVRLVTGKEQMLIYRRLKDIDDQLSLPFVRVHNSFIINLRQLQKIQDNHVYIGTKQIPISEKYRDAFMGVIQNKLF